MLTLSVVETNFFMREAQAVVSEPDSGDDIPLPSIC